MAGPIGLQQLLRMQGLEWGDAAQGDKHLWFDGNGLNTDVPFVFSALTSSIIPGATSFAIRNNANTANNFTMLDAGNAAFGTTPTADSTLRLAPTASASAGAYGLRIDPVWTNPAPGGVAYGFSENTNIVFTGNNTATGISSFYGQLNTDTSAFNCSSTLTILKGILNWNGTGNLTGTITGITITSATATTATGTIAEIGGAHINAAHAGTGLNTLMYGVVARATMLPSGGAADGNCTTAASFYSEMYLSGTAVTPGVIALAVDYLCSGPNFTSASVTNTVTAYYNIKSVGSFNTYLNTSTTGGFIAGAAWLVTGKQGGNTSGTNSNYGLQINGTGGVSASGGTAQNRALDITVPAPSLPAGATATNMGIFIQGNGGSGGASTTNWSFRNDSTAGSVFKGPITLGTNINPTAPTMQRIVATPLAALASGASVTWDGFLVDTSTLTISGSTGITTAGGVNLFTIKAPALVATGLAVTKAATLAIVGQPTISGGGTITTALALDIQSGNVSFAGLLSTYNNIATGGNGVGSLVKYTRPAQQVNATVTLATYTTPAADGSYRVWCNVNVTVSTTVTMTVTVAYTDEANVARTLTVPFFLLAGTLVQSITTAQGNIAYESLPITIRTKASTSITIATAGTVTAVTYTGEGFIEQVA